MDFIILGSLFDGPHIAYIVSSLGTTFFVLYMAMRFIKQQKFKDMFLKLWAWGTFFLHISPLWINFLKGDAPVAADNMLFPIYFCNLSMYLLLMVAIWGDKKTKAFSYLATITAYAGIFGALISLFYPEYYLHGASIFEWGVFKSMLSHSTMLTGCFYLFLGGYVKVELKNLLVYGVGLLGFGVIGILVNITFSLAGLNAPNAMYLQHPPLAEAPFLNAPVIALIMEVLILGVVSVYNLYTKKMVVKEKSFAA